MTGGIRIGKGIEAADKGCRYGSRHGADTGAGTEQTRELV